MKKEKKKINTKLSVYGLDGKVAGSIQLDEKLFDGTVNNTLLYEVNKMYEANKRQGTHSTKRRSEVAGGGKKPWKQKGTGRARVGSIRSPLWRHGGSIFGPKPRDYSFTMPKKAVRKALLSGLNIRLLENAIKPTVKIDFKEAKTKSFAKFLKNIETSGKVLVVVDKMSDSVARITNNLAKVTLKEARNVNVRDVLLNENMVIEKDALEKLAERVK